MKPICVPCRQFFQMVKAGFYFTEGMPVVNGAQRGTAEPEKWKPYKLWVADKWECKGCGAVILSGFGHGPIAEHYQTGFAEEQARLQADQFQVNDC